MILEEAVILDEEGVAYTADRFQTEPEAASKFMELIEENSKGAFLDWREMTMDQIVYEASRTLHMVEQDLITVDFLRLKGLLQ